MFKKLLTFIMLLFVVIGLAVGVYFSISSQGKSDEKQSKLDGVLETIQTKQVQTTQIFTYGKALNFSGTLPNVSKDNFESVKLYLTNGDGFEKTYPLTGTFSEGNLMVTTTEQINDGCILDDLDVGEYIVLVRLKLNNSVNPKYYSLSNGSEFETIEYDTMTKENQNKKVQICFQEKAQKEQSLAYLRLNVENAQKPENVYDIVIDAGHGGKDVGEKAGSDTEADITLRYAKALQERLEANGLKVKLTRDDSNSAEYTATNMYDANGRITTACSTKAKQMISFHINNGNKGLRGLEIYSPCKSNLELAQNMANKIVTYTDLEYSNNNSFKKGEGVYVRNFTQSVINDYTSTANKKGYAPYNITLDTPYLYTIREVGGIATNAYVDGRNTAYAANQYYRSNQGIECYQIEMGYIKNDLEIIKTQMEQYVIAISDALLESL